jgi:hypothetical protein
MRNYFLIIYFIISVSYSFSQRPKLETGKYLFGNYVAYVSKNNSSKYTITFETDWGLRVRYIENFFNSQLDILVVYNSEYDDQLKINVSSRSFRVWDGSYNWGVDYPYSWKEWYRKN